jgi:hypothetical protein
MENKELGNKEFDEAFAQLTEEEKQMLLYVYFHFSGDVEHKLPKQDELEESAKEKLQKAGIDVNNLGQYLEVKK